MSAISDIGAVLDGKYKLVRMLGSGTSGAVFEGRSVANRDRVAVKLLHRDLLQHDEHVQRFLREARSAARIHHPSVVRFLDAGRGEDGRPYLVQEFLYGEDMQQALDARSMTLPQVFEVSLQLLEALSAVHEVGLVHRDVKPENVFLLHDEFGDVRAKLVDFGIVKPKSNVSARAVNLTHSGHTVGTPHYMSPEQARGLDVDARADVWSAGVVLYEALTGELPFDGGTPTEVLVAIVTRDPARLNEKRPDLPEWLGDVVDKALFRAQDRRWQSAREMAQALRDGINPGSV